MKNVIISLLCLWLSTSFAHASTIGANEGAFFVEETSGSNTLNFTLSVGEGVSGVSAFAVGFDINSSMGAFWPNTSQTGWFATVGVEANWDGYSNSFFDGISWSDFLAFDPPTAHLVDAFVLFYTNDDTKAISNTSPQTGSFQLAWGAPGVGGGGLSPAVISTVDGGVFGGPANENVSVSAVPVPAALPLFLSGLFAFGFMRKKRV